MVDNFPYLYLPDQYVAEREAAALLYRLSKEQIDPVPGWEQFCNSLDKSQTRAVENSVRSSLNLMFGPPGSGKTTVVRRIVQTFDAAGMRVLCVAPTGKAARRMHEVIYEIHDSLNVMPKCMTTYKALEYNPQKGFTRNHRNPLDYDAVVTDEWGFVGCKHARDFLLAINPRRTRLITVGDPYQLPSVEAGSVYRDMINSRRFTFSELTEVHRTGKDSGIAYNATRILRGESPVKIDPRTNEKFNDWKFIITKSEEETRDLVIKLVAETIPEHYGVDSVKDIQVISPGKRSDVGTFNINDLLRAKLNPGVPRFKGFRLKDKVINKMTLKHLEICNGDVGIVIEIGDHGMVVDFGPGAGKEGKGIVKIEGDDCANVFLNYAQTVHSTQGSEMPVAVVPLHRCHWRLLSRNMLYTAQTRAKKAAIIIGDPEAMRQCIHHSETDSRTTGMNYWLDQLYQNN